MIAASTSLNTPASTMCALPPEFGAAHLDCVRRLRQVGRPGQAFAEAQYRCREILDRAAAGKLPPNDWQAPHHASLLIAFETDIFKELIISERDPATRQKALDEMRRIAADKAAARDYMLRSSMIASMRHAAAIQ